LYAVLWSPPFGVRSRGSILFVHPFAEELNKSRRTVAVQARALADVGWSVLQVDLYGCGDSAGDLADARWECWLQDVDHCCDWLSGRTGSSVVLWGLRLGAIIAAQVSERRGSSCERLLLWQPMLNGSGMLTTLLRQQAVAGIGSGASARKARELRQSLLEGEAMELSGYPISPELACDIDDASLETINAPPHRVDWLDVQRSDIGAGSNRAEILRQTWMSKGVRVCYQQIQGQQFWSAGEIVECRTLIDHTSRALALQSGSSSL
jgi:exosortase A-associated hydrolase 2